MSGQSLSELRKKIDKLDEQLVGLLDERAAIARQIGKSKSRAGAKFSPMREAAVLRRVTALSSGLFPNKALKGVFREIMSGCLSLQQQMTISYLGPEGTFSEEAARMRFGEMAVLTPCANLDEALREAESGNADAAVLPIENSTEGSIGRTLDLLLGTQLTICDEVTLPIRHQLMGQAASLQDVTEVTAHPQALAQCRRWLAAHLPHAAHMPAASNGEAAQRAATNRNVAAIASQHAAELNQLDIIAANIEDDPSNTTRFLVLANLPGKPTGQDKTSLVCATANTPGALLKALQAIAGEGVNMVKLESRPAPNMAWEYVFYIDLEGHAQDAPVAKALAQLKKHAAFVKILGSYPKAI